MLLVIFGAGASYDSVPHLPPMPNAQRHPVEEDRPPLANQLFADRPIFVNAMERFTHPMVLVLRLRQEGVVVERELARFREEGKTFPQRYCQLAAIQYYLHFVLWNCQDQWRQRHRGITNYLTLLDEIERWRFEHKEKVCFVTFNYDTMLDQSMESELRLPIPHIDAYITWEDYCLIKLHGSVN